MSRAAAPDSDAATRRETAIDAGLMIADPETLAGLVYPLPRDRSLSEIEQDYDTQLTTGRKVRCAVCSHHQAHYRGFVVMLDDGTRALVGRDCGEDHFGKGEWDRLAAGLRQRQDQAYLERRVQPAMNQIAVVYPLLGEWWQEVAEWDIGSVLQVEMPTLWRRLYKAALESDGRLEVQRAATITTRGRRGEEGERQTVNTETLGRIPAPLSFIGDSRHIERARSLLQTANRTLMLKQDAKSLSAAFAQIREAKKHVEDAEVIREGWQRNAAPGWWEGVAVWFNETGGGGELVVRGRAVTLSTGEERATIVLPVAGRAEPLFPRIVEEWPR